MFIVKVIEKSTGKAEKEINCSTAREAYKVDIGLSINLNHDDFETKVEELKP